MRHSFAVVLELDGSRTFDPVSFWYQLDKHCIVPSERVVMSPFVAIQLVQSKLTAGELRRHVQSLQAGGITASYVFGIDADRDIPHGHPASAWMTSRFGQVLPRRRDNSANDQGTGASRNSE